MRIRKLAPDDRASPAILRFLRAALVAAGCQLVGVVAVTSATALFIAHDLSDQQGIPSSADFESLWKSVSPTRRIRYASSVMSVSGEKRAGRKLAFLFGLSTVTFGAFTLRTPPEFLVQVGHYFGSGCIAAVGWAGAMSVCVACFGAMAHAAVKADRFQRSS